MKDPLELGDDPIIRAVDKAPARPRATPTARRLASRGVAIWLCITLTLGVAIVTAALTFLLTLSWASRHRHHEDSVAAESPDTTQPIPPLKLTSEEIATAFERPDKKKDLAEANRKYLGEHVVMTGKIRAITDTELLLSGGSDHRGVECRFEPEHQSALTTLRVGQTVTITGKCMGLVEGVGFAPAIIGCRLVQ